MDLVNHAQMARQQICISNNVFKICKIWIKIGSQNNNGSQRLGNQNNNGNLRLGNRIQHGKMTKTGSKTQPGIQMTRCGMIWIIPITGINQAYAHHVVQHVLVVKELVDSVINIWSANHSKIPVTTLTKVLTLGLTTVTKYRSTQMVSVSYAQFTQEPWLVTLTVELMNAHLVKILTKPVTVSVLELTISQFKTLEPVNATNFSLLMIQDFVKIALLTLEHKTATSSALLMAAHKMQLLTL